MVPRPGPTRRLRAPVIVERAFAELPHGFGAGPHGPAEDHGTAAIAKLLVHAGEQRDDRFVGECQFRRDVLLAHTHFVANVSRHDPDVLQALTHDDADLGGRHGRGLASFSRRRASPGRSSAAPSAAKRKIAASPKRTLRSRPTRFTPRASATAASRPAALPRSISAAKLRPWR